jgi:hypothetical protein
MGAIDLIGAIDLTAGVDIEDIPRALVGYN